MAGWRSRRSSFERRFELSERVASAFRMGPVRGEEEQLWPAQFDQPTDVLEMPRRESDLATDVVRWRHRQLGQLRLIPAERPHRVIERSQQVRHPPGAEFDASTSKIRELFEHPIEHHARKEVLRVVEDVQEV